MVFQTQAARMGANIVAAQCHDLGMTEITRWNDGKVTCALGPVRYLMDRDVDHQQVRVLDREVLLCVGRATLIPAKPVSVPDGA